jgi:Orsellinic acid/F9775 biosynthesis cluster protein D
MDKDLEPYIRYLPEYRVVICLLHGYCLSGRIATHFEHQHRSPVLRYLPFPLHFRLKMDPYQKTLDLVPDNEVASPTEETYIPGLTLHDGHKCHECGFVSASEKVIKQHCTKVHKRKKQDRTFNIMRYADYLACMWKPQKVQTFFPTTKAKYFAVNAPLDALAEYQNAISSANQSSP